MATSDFNKGLQELSSQLNSTDTNYVSIQGTCTNLLKLNDQDDDVWRCYAVSLLRQRKEMELYRKMDTRKFRAVKEDDEELQFFHAYAAYRCSKIEEAQSMLNSLNTVEAQHLKAQIFYDLQMYDEALNIYSQMNFSEDPHGATNMCACAIKGQNYSEAVQTRLQASMFHYLNVALAYIKLGQFSRAIDLLDQAVEIGETDEESAEDIVEAKVTLAYCYEQVNEIEKATEIYNHIQNASLSNDFVQLMLLTNKCTGGKIGTMSAYEKFCTLDEVTKLKKSVTSEEKAAVERNHCIFLMKCNQKNACRSYIGASAVLDQQTKIMLRASLEGAHDTKKALEIVQKGLESISNENVDDLLLIYATLFLRNRRTSEAIEALRRIEKLRFYPALVTVLSTLLTNENRVDEALQEIDSSVEFWKQKSHPKSEEIIVDLKLLKADLLSKVHRQEEVAQIFTNLSQVRSKNATKIKAKLIQALAFTDVNRAKQMCDELSIPIEQDVDPIDLIEQGSVSIRKKRKLKLDAQYEQIKANRQAARERNIKPKHENHAELQKLWLPKHKKRRKGKKAVGILRGPQGANFTSI